MYRNGIYFLHDFSNRTSLAIDVEPTFWDSLVKRKKNDNRIKNSPSKVLGTKCFLFTVNPNLVALAIHSEEMDRYAQNFTFLYGLKKFKEMKREYLKTQCIIQHTLLSDEGSHDINNVDISLNFEFYGKHLWRYWCNTPSPSVSHTIEIAYRVIIAMSVTVATVKYGFFKLELFNNYFPKMELKSGCFPTATMVWRRRFNVTFIPTLSIFLSKNVCTVRPRHRSKSDDNIQLDPE